MDNRLNTAESKISKTHGKIISEIKIVEGQIPQVQVRQIKEIEIVMNQIVDGTKDVEDKINDKLDMYMSQIKAVVEKTNSLKGALEERYKEIKVIENRI